MIVKSCKIESHVANLEETFIALKKYDIKLNPKKHSFGVGAVRKVSKVCCQPKGDRGQS